MKIDSLSQIKKLISLCRKNGVTAIEIDGFKMNILELRQKPRKTSLNDFPEASVRVPSFSPIQAQESQDEAITTSDMIATDELSSEQLMYYSVKGEPQ